MITRGKYWNAYYRGWFAARSDRRQPSAESMVEHSYVADGYVDGKNSGGGSAISRHSDSQDAMWSGASGDSDSSKSGPQAEPESEAEALDKSADSAE